MDEATLPRQEDTLRESFDALSARLMEVATEDWQEAQLSFKKDGDGLLIDWLRVPKA
jgi:hypothetical protein